MNNIFSNPLKKPKQKLNISVNLQFAQQKIKLLIKFLNN